MAFLKNVAALRVDPDSPARMIVRGFNGLPLKDDDGSTNYIDVYSMDSAVARDFWRAAGKKLVAAADEPTAEERDAQQVDFLVALTAGWGSLDKDGNVAPEEFTKDAARALYSDKENVEIRNQVDRFAGTRRNFSKASSNS